MRMIPIDLRVGGKMRTKKEAEILFSIHSTNPCMVITQLFVDVNNRYHISNSSFSNLGQSGAIMQSLVKNEELMNTVHFLGVVRLESHRASFVHIVLIVENKQYEYS